MELIIIQISYLVQAGAVFLLLLIGYKTIRAISSPAQSMTQRILKHGSKAKAKVLSAEPSASTQGDNKIKLLLQVEPERGRNFIVEIFTDEYSKNLHPGSTVTVMYNPINHEQVVLADKI
ncbi:hypothetical protein [Dyadobacter luticola]|uniref:DUF3592 domain-containing protein n=1 Tax=Dyadobacter luticola TaxID=1979387 RepID=A0A5R9L449_9BACT|nr:hypothetical protein [Dyadobacter luticola]TLV03364.1 hypothetical protein FEN17_07070 [Dyadobacter luticola]